MRMIKYTVLSPHLIRRKEKRPLSFISCASSTLSQAEFSASSIPQSFPLLFYHNIHLYAHFLLSHFHFEYLLLITSSVTTAVMAATRATKSGFAAEAKQKMDAKYDEELASQILQWMSDLLSEGSNGEANNNNNNPSIINTDGSMDNMYEVLKDGTLLCRLINVLQAGTIPESKIKKSTMAFKCMETITLFLSSCKKLGVLDHELFQTVDLWEQQNMASVLTCLQSLARKAAKFGKNGLGPKEADANRRSFTDEQLKAGDSVISLQYGSNKGATQHGISFGNTRHM